MSKTNYYLLAILAVQKVKEGVLQLDYNILF